MQENCLPTAKIYSQSRANTYSFAELDLCQDFSATQSGEHKWKMEQNKQALRQIFGSYPSNLSNVFLSTGMQGGSRVAYSPVYRLLKNIFIFFLALFPLPKKIWLSRTGFPSQTVHTCDLKSKRKDIYENRETKSSGNSTLNKPCLPVPNSSVNKSCSIHHCWAREIKGRLKAGEEAWGEAEQLQNKSIWQW